MRNPPLYLSGFRNDTSTLVVELALISIGGFLTFKAYWPVGKTQRH
jgi:hypothetical protein